MAIGSQGGMTGVDRQRDGDLLLVTSCGSRSRIRSPTLSGRLSRRRYSRNDAGYTSTGQEQRGNT